MIDSTAVEPIEIAVQRFRALGDPTRLRVLHVLAERGLCVCEIQARLDVPANLLSHHLKVLREAELVVAERRGRWIHYELDADGLAAVGATLPGAATTAPHPACTCGREGVRA